MEEDARQPMNPGSTALRGLRGTLSNMAYPSSF
jgi:hypothetical protein